MDGTQNITDWENYTTEQLIAIAREKRIEAEQAYPRDLMPPVAGREMFFETELGKIRALTYNIESYGILPVFVNLHGGGFVMGSAESDDPFMPSIAEGANVRVINVDYSLAPENPFPRAVEEVYAVLRYLKRNADELRIDPNRIALGGHSAGGNFTASVCIMDAERKEIGIRCAILDYPPLDVYTDPSMKPQPAEAIPVDMGRLFDACYHNVREERKNPLISPLYASYDQLQAFPPTLIITAEYDSLCNESEKFWKKMKNVNDHVEYKCFKGCYHGFTHENVPEARLAWETMISFLQRNLS